MSDDIDTQSQPQPRLWRSLEEWRDGLEPNDVEQDELDQADPEFVPGQSEWPEGVSRRDFLHLSAAAIAMSTAAGCTSEPDGEVVPYVRAPEQVVPGDPQYCATAFLLDGFAQGVLVESHTGRPTKVEGNPEHPWSLGATSAIAQASVWGLYDTQRASAVAQQVDGEFVPRSWQTVVRRLRALLAEADNAGSVRILTETVTSPTLIDQLEGLAKDHRQIELHHWSPINFDNTYQGTKLAFGRRLQPRYAFDNAEVVVVADADFLHEGPGALAYARQWASRRAARVPDPHMNRMYALEATMSVTGSKADDRLRIEPGRVEGLLRELAHRLGVETAAYSFEPDAGERRWLEELVVELEEHRSRSLIIAGTSQPPQVHALAWAINAHLGNVGQTVTFGEPPVLGDQPQLESLRELVADIDRGQVDSLLILGGNPAYDSPADIDFGQALDRVDFTLHLSTYLNETSRRSDWLVPRTHYLESWGDGRAVDGTVTVMQPIIAPLFSGRGDHEILAAMRGSDKSVHAIVMAHWRQVFGADRFEYLWRHSLHEGLVPHSDFPPQPVALQSGFDQLGPSTSGPSKGDQLTLIFGPDPALRDGRYANIGMLQELPRPITSLTWDNAALIAPKTAHELGVENEDVVELEFRGRVVDAPVWIQPGMAESCVAVWLGYGKKDGGSLEVGRGFNAYQLRGSEAMWFGQGLSVQKTGRTFPLAATQGHHRMHGHSLVESSSLAALEEKPYEVTKKPKHHGTLYPEYDYESYAWAMTIDQTLCIGCNACVAACQVENNTPVVGKEQVRMAREMHWLRVDTYYKGPAEEPEVYHQPVPCMHCEKAPCEVVCPVAATTHSAEGINEMTYNRCIGTRYCSNNCPYKVRRFNFLEYTGEDNKMVAALDLKHNPDVTVRSRGVMEKCTYCIQRINAARVEAKKRDIPIPDGAIETACQQVCPTEAIVFGDKSDPATKVSRLKEQPHNYALLDELNTRPRTTYLAAINNPNLGLQVAGVGEKSPVDDAADKEGTN